MTQVTEKEFLAFFDELDRRLAEENPSCKTVLYVFGGAAAAFLAFVFQKMLVLS